MIDHKSFNFPSIQFDSTVLNYGRIISLGKSSFEEIYQTFWLYLWSTIFKGPHPSKQYLS